MARTKRNHYETLGVSPTASTDEIKRARRTKARKAHPDRGGDPDEMAAINHAADVLLDPLRRQLYDATGAEQVGEDEQHILGLLAEAFTDALQREANRILPHARGFIEHRLEAIHASRQQNQKALKRMRDKRATVTVKGENLFHALINQQIVQCTQAIVHNERAIEIIEAALKRLDAYKEKEDSAITSQGARLVAWGSSATTGTR